MEELFNWPAMEAHLVDPDDKATRRPGYPAQTLLRALLLGIWYGLSDQRLGAKTHGSVSRRFRVATISTVSSSTPGGSRSGRRSRQRGRRRWSRFCP